MKILGLFPGQGSQTIGMAKDWYQNTQKAKEIFAIADEVLGFKLSSLCFEGPLEELTLTQNAQPALLTSSYISYVSSDIPVSVAAGHSLGEYTALVVAGVLKFEDALKLVRARGQYMQAAVPLNAGAMVAVMGMDEEVLNEKLSSHPNLLVEIANINSPGQIVLAGEKEAVSQFCEILNSEGAKTIPLNVSAPFHCSLMKPAADKLSFDIDQVDFADPKIKVYSNFTAKEIRTAQEAKQALKDQVCGTVNWTKQIKNIVQEEGVDSAIEFGPGGVLSKLLKRIDSSIKRYEVFNPKSLEETKAKLG